MTVPAGSAGPPLRIVIADDQASVREGLVLLLGGLPGIEVVGAAADGEQALELVAEHEPDAILLDLHMPVLDGIGAIRRLTAEHPGVAIVVLTTYADDSSVLDALHAGARSYLTKDADRTDITWSTDDDMEKAHVAYVSGNMFPLFGLEPALGRLLSPADDRGPGLNPYAVLSWDYWNHRFGRDPHVLGSSLHIGDKTVEIIGVGPRDFTGTEKGTITDIFLPLSMNRLATQDRFDWHRIFLMLKPGVNATTALEPLRQHLSAVNRAFGLECSTCFRGATQTSIERYLNQKIALYPAGAGISELQKDYRRSLGILGLLVALVLLIACVNVANMMTAQAAARTQEMALRISIGAGRRRLVQLILGSYMVWDARRLRLCSRYFEQGDGDPRAAEGSRLSSACPIGGHAPHPRDDCNDGPTACVKKGMC